MKIRTEDALKYAKIQKEFYEKEWKETQRIHQELLEESKKKFFVKIGWMSPEGLDEWDWGWYNQGKVKAWSSIRNKIIYHQKIGNEFIDSPFKDMNKFYNWAAENNIPY